MYFDPLYFIFIAPAMALGLWAQFRVKSAFAMGSQVAASSRMCGAEVAQSILDASGVSGVRIERIDGALGDHYDPRSKTLRLSPEVYAGHSLSSLGVAAHEVGHALQDAGGYLPLILRNGIVPLAAIGSNVSFGLMFLGAMMSSINLIMLGIAAFSLVVVFQLVNLPVEFNASARARQILVDRGFISPREEQVVAKVLNAAALTYVAATVTAIAQLLYFLVRYGGLGRSHDEHRN